MEKFTDLMVKDTVTGESLRADKLLEDIIDELLAKTPAMPKVTNTPRMFIVCVPTTAVVRGAGYVSM